MKLFRISTVSMSLNILLNGQLRYLRQFYDVTAISGAGSELDEVEEREGVKVHPIAMERQISPLKDVMSLIRLYRFFKREKPDVIHSITPKAGLLSMIAGKWAGVPVRMHTFTGLIFPHKAGHFQTLLIWMDRVLCHYATHIYPEGNGVKGDLERYRITKKPLKILANGNVNGVDTEYFSRPAVAAESVETLRHQLGIRDDDFVFVFVGRLVRDKGINELVTAFKNLASTPLSDRAATGVGGVKLLLVGSLEQHLDPLKSAVLSEIDTNPNIINVGFQQDVRTYFALSNALVFPSYREGFPNVVLQAGAMELPSIVTNISGSTEIIEEGTNGLIIPVKDSAALENAMHRLAGDRNLYRSMRERTRFLVESRYRQDRVWEALLEEYRRLERLPEIG
ncbi:MULTISPECIES: glycosyltransferase family 4 protein [unclassified Kaistella]|uniref:glycosyltransferase family 4 protein n=1 Tax=unclassified Kaistella TaxID=2762626 RepID=UPI0027333C85|nr:MULTISPECIES: glycosyltransferase family 4 protein [unclassified Kaistella]MDP2452512.1 glycosyltransferase family 4 protein [Kaistella sp. SH11-4b]MDP2455420.1 glycosyltransferase family 4 protein [Kaistella sp. SH40-3]MDP2458324.1 glycosyltransferase family 4 protein [Kaistella sp. SH19-2b]